MTVPVVDPKPPSSHLTVRCAPLEGSPVHLQVDDQVEREPGAGEVCEGVLMLLRPN